MNQDDAFPGEATQESDTIPAAYRGRFAPSPTGPLHLGSLLAAAASFLRARQAKGKWLLRIEDIDPPREMPGAADGFLRTLEQFGFEWDDQVVYQSTRHAQYREALEHLARSSLAYRCQCSRKDIRVAIETGTGRDGVYPGTCLHQPPATHADVNWRFAAAENKVSIQDALQGRHSAQFGYDQGDFVIWRKENLPSYQLAVSVDDLAFGITEVVRGIDLLHETPGQVLLHRHLRTASDTTETTWMHLPLLVDGRGDKLSKQTHATPVEGRFAAQHLTRALGLLGLSLPDGLERAAVQEIWHYAIANWNPKCLYKRQTLRLDQVQ